MSPITITESAAKQLLNLLQTAPSGTQGVRLSVKSTGCSGNSYTMEFITAKDTVDKDDKFEAYGATLYIPRMHSWMLFGVHVDYVVDSLGNAKFTFVNPNEAGRCGCGESFQVDSSKSPQTAA